MAAKAWRKRELVDCMAVEYELVDHIISAVEMAIGVYSFNLG